MDGLRIPLDTFMMEAGSLGRSRDIGCSLSPVLTDPMGSHTDVSNRMINHCGDFITLARHGIFGYYVPATERVPARYEYTSPFADLFHRVADTVNHDHLDINDNSAGKMLLDRILAMNKVCSDAIQKLLDQIGSIRSGRAQTIGALYDELNTQRYLGIHFNSDPYRDGNAEYQRLTGSTDLVGGGGGLSFRLSSAITYNVNGTRMNGVSEAFVYVLRMGVSPGQYRSPVADRSNVQRQITTSAYRTFGILIHEMFHVAARNGMFGHIDMDRAAKALDSSLVYKGYKEDLEDAPLFDAYVRKNCPDGIH
jgi:hypothetical protein